MDGTATAGEDYTAASGIVTIAARSKGASIIVGILDDNLDEPHEYFTVELENPENATIEDGSGRGHFRDQDEPTISVERTTASESAGTALITFRLDMPSVWAITAE